LFAVRVSVCFNKSKSKIVLQKSVNLDNYFYRFPPAPFGGGKMLRFGIPRDVHVH